MHRIIGGENRTLEGSFILAFSAIETLLNSYSVTIGLDKILRSKDGKNPWKTFESELKQWIDKMSILSKSRYRIERELVRQKITELNRPTLGVVLDHFCERYDIDLSDLWPIKGDGNGVTLATLRNYLAHGQVFEGKNHSASIGARSHLIWTAERMILRMLGWPISESYLKPTFLSRHLCMYKSLEEDRQILSQWKPLQSKSVSKE